MGFEAQWGLRQRKEIKIISAYFIIAFRHTNEVFHLMVDVEIHLSRDRWSESANKWLISGLRETPPGTASAARREQP